jgi:hypothetical protein
MIDQPDAAQDATTRIAEIAARVAKATPGPWAWESTGEKSNDYAIGTAVGPDDKPISGRFETTDDPQWASERGIFMVDTIIARHLIGEGENGNFADADFIAHAREDIPFLLAALTRAQEQQEETRKQRAEAEMTLVSLGTMLGWMNIPPRHIFEAEIRAMKARIQAIPELESRLAALTRERLSPEPAAKRSYNGHIDPDCEVYRGVGACCTCETPAEKADRERERAEIEAERDAETAQEASRSEAQGAQLAALRAALVSACEFITAEQWQFMRADTRNSLRALLSGGEQEIPTRTPDES